MISINIPRCGRPFERKSDAAFLDGTRGANLAFRLSSKSLGGVLPINHRLAALSHQSSGAVGRHRDRVEHAPVLLGDDNYLSGPQSKSRQLTRRTMSPWNVLIVSTRGVGLCLLTHRTFSLCRNESSFRERADYRLVLAQKVQPLSSLSFASNWND